MKIFINGQPHEVPGPKTLRQTIEQFCKNTKHVIAELNGQIIKAQHWDATLLKEDDRLELVSIVGGG